MSRGQPDWGFGRVQTVHVLSEDLAELAARLGSIHTYDRRGYVVWSDDFAGGIGAWVTTSDGAGSSVAASTVNPKWPPNCVKLVGGTGGDRSAQIANQFGAIISGVCGVEFSIDLLTDFYECRIGLALDAADGARQPAIKLDGTTDKIYLLNGVGFWEEIADLPILFHSTIGYHNLKLVVDFDNDYYVRFMLDDVEYDLSAHAIHNTVTFGRHRLRARVFYKSRSAGGDYCYVDGVIITQNE